MQVSGPQVAMLAVPAGVGLVLVWRSLSASMARRRAAERMYRSQEERERGVPTGSSDELWGSWLEGWLYVSGYRDPKAVSNYLLLQGLALAAGVVVTLLVSGAWWLELGVTWLREIPGGVGDLLAPSCSPGSSGAPRGGGGGTRPRVQE